MDLQSNLIESTNRKKKGAGKFSVAALAVHGLVIAFIVFMSTSATHEVTAEEKPIRAFLASSAAPPPPPPPPPAPSSAPLTPEPTLKPVHVPQKAFVQPTEILQGAAESRSAHGTDCLRHPTPASNQPSGGGEPGGVPGGVVGGVAGGVQGGVVGGKINGNVDRVRVLKGLPMGLADEAENAVRQWRFKPGTLNGEPVDVIFSLTVNFTLDQVK